MLVSKTRPGVGPLDIANAVSVSSASGGKIGSAGFELLAKRLSRPARGGTLAMAGASVWVVSASLPQLPSILGRSPPRGLVLDSPTARQLELGGPVPAFDVHSRHIYGGLVSLTVKHGPIHRHARALFTALALMPRLEELELCLVTWSPYEKDLPVPTLRLRKYVYCNYRTFELDRANALGTGVSNWSLPLAVSANTLRHVYILLHGSREFQEAHSIPSLDCVEYLGLRGNAVHGFPGDSRGYACLIARCPRLRHLALHYIRLGNLERDLQLITAAVTMLREVDLSLRIPAENAPLDWEQAHAEVDAALARALRDAPPLRLLRTLALDLRLFPDAPVPALTLTRAACAEQQIALRLIQQREH